MNRFLKNSFYFLSATSAIYGGMTLMRYSIKLFNYLPKLLYDVLRSKTNGKEYKSDIELYGKVAIVTGKSIRPK